MKRLQGTAKPPITNNFFTVGNRLVIDLANTVVSPDGTGDGLRSWGDLVDFLVTVGQVAPGRRDQINLLEKADPQGTARVFRQALDLRNAARLIVEAVASGRPIEATWVGPINGVLRVTEGHDELLEAEGGWRLGFVRREQRLEWLLAAVARSAAELVEEGPQAPVRKCAGPRCLLYFYDTSRTRRRRWCSMAVCGNRSKVAAFAGRRQRARGRTR